MINNRDTIDKLLKEYEDDLIEHGELEPREDWVERESQITQGFRELKN